MFQGLAHHPKEWWAAQANVCQLQILHNENTCSWLSTLVNHIGNSVVQFSVSDVHSVKHSWTEHVLLVWKGY